MLQQSTMPRREAVLEPNSDGIVRATRSYDAARQIEADREALKIDLEANRDFLAGKE